MASPIEEALRRRARLLGPRQEALTGAMTGLDFPEGPAIPTPAAGPSQPNDLDSLINRLYGQQPQPSPVREAIGRALIGFGRGAQATPAGAQYDPLLGGLVGGLTGTGASVAEDLEARRHEGGGQKELLQDVLKARLGEEIKEPFRIRQEEREQAGRKELEGLRAQRIKERTAALQALQSEDPRLFGDAVDLVSKDRLVQAGLVDPDEFQSRVSMTFQALRAARSRPPLASPPPAAGGGAGAGPSWRQFDRPPR